MTNTRDVERRDLYSNWLTPVEDHFVCQQGRIPEIDAEEWTVSLTGAVEQEVDLSVAELKSAYPTVAVAHTMECAGNGRHYLDPETGAPPWDVGGIGNAFWTGTPLSTVLQRHGAETGEDMWVTAVGGEAPRNERVFARSVPIAKILDDCILAYGINGEPLPRGHGYPIRTIVPGWYGVNSVKWVSELRVMDRMVTGESWPGSGDLDYAHWHQDSYRMTPPDTEPIHHEQVEATEPREQLTIDGIEHPYPFDQHVKSVIGYPDNGATVQPLTNGQVEVLGLAWAGDDAVETIEVSTDGGESWNEAASIAPTYSGAWELFRYVWRPDPGTYTLLSRATDEHGRQQPATVSEPVEDLTAVADDEYPWNEGGYGMNAYEPHAVEVTVEEAA